MTFLKKVLAASALFVMFSGASFAHSTSHSKYYHDDEGGSCGSSGSVSDCENPVSYNEYFETTDFKKDGYYFFDFDAIEEPGDNFEITRASISISTTGSGYLYAQKGSGYWSSLTSFSAGTNTFTLSSSWYDEILEGINFAVLLQSFCHSYGTAIISYAKLTVEGEYCPPSEVPVPATAFLLAPALIGFVGLRRKAQKA